MSSNHDAYTHDAAFDAGFLTVGSIHKIYYEQYGKRDGKPVAFLHGGPGDATSPKSAQFFDPAVYRVVLFDQRGCGKSTPVGELRENKSMDLVSDIETLRSHLAIEKWHCVFGGSWGSTLALLYAQAHPSMVGSLVLRGVFLMSQEEIDFTVQSVAVLFPEVYEKLYSHLRPEERSDPISGFNRLLFSTDLEVATKAARAYTEWVVSISTLLPPSPSPTSADGLEWIRQVPPEDLIASCRINNHYFIHRGWLRDFQLLEPGEIEKIALIPCAIVNGRYDVLCPPAFAYRLHKALKNSTLHIVSNAGHSSSEPGIKTKLIEICDEFGKMDF